MSAAKAIIRQALGAFHGIKGEIVDHQVWDIPANVLVLRLPIQFIYGAGIILVTRGLAVITFSNG